MGLNKKCTHAQRSEQLEHHNDKIDFITITALFLPTVWEYRKLTVLWPCSTWWRIQTKWRTRCWRCVCSRALFPRTAICSEREGGRTWSWRTRNRRKDKSQYGHSCRDSVGNCILRHQDKHTELQLLQFTSFITGYTFRQSVSIPNNVQRKLQNISPFLAQYIFFYATGHNRAK